MENVEANLTESVEVRRASYAEKSVLRQLLELYSYDFSQFDSADVDEYGMFGYRYLDHYWTEKKRHPFLVLVAGRIAGFALIQEVEREGYPSSFLMSEFFIMKKYRSQGIGQAVAFYLFDLFTGEWSVSQIAANYPAQRFWRKVIARYTGGQFEEIQVEGWEGVVQTFNARHKDSNQGGDS